MLFNSCKALHLYCLNELRLKIGKNVWVVCSKRGKGAAGEVPSHSGLRTVFTVSAKKIVAPFSPYDNLISCGKQHTLSLYYEILPIDACPVLEPATETQRWLTVFIFILLAPGDCTAKWGEGGSLQQSFLFCYLYNSQKPHTRVWICIFLISQCSQYSAAAMMGYIIK